ncbi:hypothetical protein PENTCL1PPCAC_11079 [Pristionchus entomophagus]|uniref:Transthyretin-like protein 5 n=1 Tax=Pristionchus entomophagus TaxID=358040 RepID=A0AAV5T5K3_9BILA|nr:hypothetical protein PENTCL1PPCAC_11079 [Pristionchus entomophagus]
MFSTSLLIAAVAASLLATQTAAVGFSQSAAVVGNLMCHGRPASHVTVKLYDDDTGPDLDDLMDEGQTDAQGRFSLSGTTDEVLTIDPKVNIYHDCDDGIMPCQRRITIFVPSSYVSSGKSPSKTYNAGNIELAGKFEGEERDCLHKRR